MSFYQRMKLHYLLSKKHPKLLNSIIRIRCITSSTTHNHNNNHNNNNENHNNEKTSSTQSGLFGVKNLRDSDDFLKLTTKAIKNIQNIRKFIAQTKISSSLSSSSSSSSSLSSSSPSSSLLLSSSSLLSSSLSLSSIIYNNNNSSSNSNENDKISSIHPSLCLLLLDEISCQLCGVVDVAELCRNIHISDIYKYKAEATFDQLSKVIHQLNNDVTLYQRLLIILLIHYHHQINDDNDGHDNDDDVDCSDKYVLSEEELLFVMDMKREFESEGKIELESSIVI